MPPAQQAGSTCKTRIGRAACAAAQPPLVLSAWPGWSAGAALPDAAAVAEGAGEGRRGAAEACQTQAVTAVSAGTIASRGSSLMGTAHLHRLSLRHHIPGMHQLQRLHALRLHQVAGREDRQVRRPSQSRRKQRQGGGLGERSGRRIRAAQGSPGAGPCHLQSMQAVSGRQPLHHAPASA